MQIRTIGLSRVHESLHISYAHVMKLQVKFEIIKDFMKCQNPTLK